MRTQTIRVRPDDAGARELPFAAVRDRIVAATAGGVSTIVLAGDPLRRGDLLPLVRVARAHGAADVVLVTDAAQVGSEDDARRLAAAGVTQVVITVGRADPRPLLAGAARCLAAGLAVTVRLPIGRGLPPAADRLAWIVDANPALTTFELGALVADEAAAAEIVAAAQAAPRTAKVSLAADAPLPPCLAELPPRWRPLLSERMRTEGAPNQAHEACARCALSTTCTVGREELARAAAGRDPRPVADAAGYARPGRSPGSRLKVLGAADTEQFFHVDYEYGADAAVGTRPTSRIGIIYRCNQVCTFCELADMDVDLAPAKIRAALDAARARGSTRVIITGGEPTLSPDLVEHVAYARAVGFEEIELQTNAVLLDRPGAAQRLRDAGLTSAQISLHGPDEAVSDRLTAAPGTHRRTLRGVDELLAAGVTCLLNHLVFKDNCQLLLDFVEMVAARWGEHRARVVVQFHSARNEFPTREEALRHIAPYRDYAALLRRAIDRGRALGLRVRDLQDPTGIPSLCVLGADESYLGPILDQGAAPRYHAWESEWLTRVPACSGCDAREKCMGVPRHYLALHGDAEFAPIKRARGAG